jgi:hypothetical protein
VGDRVLFLSSGDTDLVFRVECRFSKSDYEKIRQRREQEYRIRGLYTVMHDANTLRLDNCELDMPRRLGPVVTPDFLPHKPGNSFTIDVATYGELINNKPSNVVRRQVHVQGKEGSTEVIMSHIGKFGATTKSLFDESAPENWVEDKNRRIHLPPSSSGIYFRRVNAGFIENGTLRPRGDGSNKIEMDWTPILKLDVRAGDKWTWGTPAGGHEYMLEKFEDYRGAPAAVVREIVTLGSDVLHPIEILHVYAKGLGEVERKEWVRLDQRGSKKLLSEMRWVQTSPLNRGSGSKAVEGKPSGPPPAPSENKTSAPPKK